MKKPTSKSSIIVIIYVILIVAWFVLWLTIGDANWLLVLINRVVPYLFVPVPLFLVWGILSRRSRLTVVLLIPCLVFVWIYHSYLFPGASRSNHDGLPLTVMTYNVLFSNQDYDSVSNVILTYQPDLVALQEVKVEMMDALKDRLASDYPYFLMGTENTFGTTAVFSKYPFADSHVLDLQADRPATIVKTNIGEHNVTFVAIHLLAYGLQWVDVKNIPEAVAQRTSDQN